MPPNQPSSTPDQPISLLVGLCNPGKQYEDTRHNAGAWLIERIARHYRCDLARSKFAHGLIGSFTMTEPQHQKNPGQNHSSAPRKTYLLLPETFMNLSGQSVRSIMDFLKLSPETLMVVHDELDLSPGGIKLKYGGGHAGHNGIKNIIHMLGTDKFWRLRIGIGHPRNNPEAKSHHQPVADYVLQVPSQNDQHSIHHAIDRVFANLPLIIHGQFTAAANQLHSTL